MPSYTHTHYALSRIIYIMGNFIIGAAGRLSS